MTAKKSSKGKAPKKETSMSAHDHRKLAEMHHAKARLHSARADLADAMNPPKKGKGPGIIPY